MKVEYIEIPQNIMLSIRLPKAEVKDRLRIELAIRLYQKGLLGFGKARELAELNKWQFQEIICKEGIDLNYDAEELEQDIQALGDYDVYSD